MGHETSSRRPDIRSRRAPQWQERLLVGAILALALFSFEAGLAYIGLSRDAACRTALISARVAPAAGSECLSELGLAVTDALARGPVGVFSRVKLTIATWVLSGGLYAALGGVCAQLKLGRALVAYLGLHASLLIATTFVLYLGPHVVV